MSERLDGSKRLLLLHYLPQAGLIQVKVEGWTGFSDGWQGCSKGFPEGKAQGKSRGAAQPAGGKPHPSYYFTWIYILVKLGHFGDYSEHYKY